MQSEVKNMQDLEVRLALLEQKAMVDAAILRNTAQDIKHSLAPVNMLKMAMQRSSLKDLPVNDLLKDGALLAGDILGNKFFGHKRFSKFKSFALPLYHIAKSKFKTEKEEAETEIH